MSKSKHRNFELAIVLKSNPTRLKTRVREGKKRKNDLQRSTRKAKEKKDLNGEI